MPAYQNRLIEEIAAVQPNTIVVLHNGAPVEMPWAEQVKGILESYLGGEAVGEAQTDILFGAVSPSGKLSESFPESWRIIRLIYFTAMERTRQNIGRAFLSATAIMTRR